MAALIFLAAPLFSEDLDDPNLDPDRRNEIIQSQEDKWGYEEESVRLPQGIQVSDILRKMLNCPTLSFNPRYFQKLRLGPLSIEVPANTFSGESVEVQALILQTPADYALADISLEYRESGKPVVLESDGMFQLTFLQGGKPVEPASAITVKMSPQSGDSMNMYRRDGDSWTEMGSTGMVTDWPEGCDVRRDDRNPGLILVESPYCEGEYPAVRVFRDITRSGWWNFDKPADNITCITGDFNSPNKNYTVLLRAVGLDYLGLSHAVIKGKRFGINVAANQSVKVYALVTDKDSRSVYVGSLEPVKTQNKTEFIDDRDFNGCQDVGSLKLKRSSVRLLTDRKAFLSVIGLPEGGI